MQQNAIVLQPFYGCLLNGSKRTQRLNVYLAVVMISNKLYKSILSLKQNVLTQMAAFNVSFFET